MLIDMHIHPIYYKSICTGEKVDFRSNAFGVFKQSPMEYDEIFAEWDVAGIDKAALLPLDLTTTEGGWVVSNEEIAELVENCPDRFIGFASVDPARKDAVEILEHAFSDLGLQGLKLNPAKQHFFPDQDSMDPIYNCCRKYNKPILFHAGLSWEPNAPADFAHPLRFERVAIQYPDLRICLAHFAWPWIRETVMLMIKYPNVYTDTSVLYLDSPEESMNRLFTIDMGPLWFERSLWKQVMFASNGPRFRAFKMKRALDKIPMRDYARKALYGENALRFLYGEEEMENG